MKNTPGPAGYLLAWVASAAVVDLAFVGDTVVNGGGPVSEAIPALLFYGYVTMVFSAPFACVGIPLVHFTCRNVSAQWVHVVVAAAAGWTPVVTLSLIAGQGPGFGDGLALLPIATAIGRWSVVPLVWRRREMVVSPGALVAS
jgi:hypothetical protein